jgi:ADP-ribose pyrophosphatase YjhB (NUDIX family)
MARRQSSIRSLRPLFSRFFGTVTLGVQAVVIDGQGRIFLVRHSYVPGWHLPGGGVEVGETLVDALARELVEECSIALVEPPVLHGVFLNSRISRRDHVVVYVVRRFRQDPVLQPNYEIIEHGFFHPDALPEDTSRAARRRLAEVLQGTPIAEHW